MYSIHQVQHTPSKAYTEYCIHWVKHTLSTAYTAYCIIPRSTVFPLPASLLISRQTMVYSILYIPTITSLPMNRVSAPVVPPSRTTASRLTASNYSSNVARSWPPIASSNSLDHSLEMYLQIRKITASKCISKLAPSQPPSVCTNSLDYSLQVRTITASKCVSKLARSQPPSVSTNSLDYGFQVRTITASKWIFKLARSQPPGVSPNSHNLGLQTRTITASECIFKFTRSRCGEMVYLEGRQPIIMTPPHLVWHPKGILEQERLRLEGRRKMVRGYERIPGNDGPHTLSGSMNARLECVRPRAGKDGVSISYNEMMSIYPGVFQLYTPCRWVHLRYPCISVCVYIERLR